MKITIFGIYSTLPEYPRTNNLLRSLRGQKISVHECHFPIVDRFQKRNKAVNSLWGAMSFFFKLACSYIYLIVKFFKQPSSDVLLVLYPGLFHVHFAKILCLFVRKKPIVVYDFFFSMCDTLVNDRKYIQQGSLRSRILFVIERSSLRSADIILTDTATHSQYFSRKYGIEEKKFHSVPVGSTFNIAEAKAQEVSNEDKLKLLFVGTYIPLQGIETILRAASLIKHDKGITITLVGAGQLDKEMQAVAEQLDLHNVKFIDWVPHDQLLDKIHQYDICLGIFGATQKARNVIPIKVYDICAAGLPLISAETPAMREMFTHKDNAYLVPAGDPEKLAQAIMTLKGDIGLRQSLATGAAQTYNRRMSPRALGARIASALDYEIR